MPRSAFQDACHHLAVGQRVDLADLMGRWQRMGYRVEQTVDAPGAVSRRGGILDIYPPVAELPARIELVGDLVESIRLFDPTSQRSVKPDRKGIHPAGPGGSAGPCRPG